MSATEDAIDNAITAHAKALDYRGVLAGWVVLAAVVDHDGEDVVSGIVTIYPGGEQPWHTALGIVEAGRLHMQRQYLTGDD